MRTAETAPLRTSPSPIGAKGARRAGLAALLLSAAVLAVAPPLGAGGAPATAEAEQARQAFLQSIDDLPLMAGLVERPRASVVFETAAGRIVEAEALSAPARGLTAGGVLNFYERTLTALGWRSFGSGRFARDGEILSIIVRPENQGLRVSFSLRPM
ncbi:MAG: hypothetical protein R3229_13395 [Alphaproteobacteria bacterium]|nr:hypothetical protein [Alphaproteobacteria bacterium]